MSLGGRDEGICAVKTLVILQSSYIPWKGYFDLLAAADEFVIYDEVGYSKGDWRNRNRIVLGGQLKWLTIPVRTSGKLGQPINEVDVADRGWALQHVETIRQAYRKAPFFAETWPLLRNCYDAAASHKSLSEVNTMFLREIVGHLGISTAISDSRDTARTTIDPVERLIELCRAKGATRYLSGPAARAYLRAEAFREAGIELAYANYSGYPAYDQSCEPFQHGVSIVDLLCQVGREAGRRHLKSLVSPDAFIRVEAGA